MILGKRNTINMNNSISQICDIPMGGGTYSMLYGDW